MMNKDVLDRLESALKSIFDRLKTTASSEEAFQGLQRQELEISLLPIFILGLAVTALLYAILLPARASYFGALLYDRGLTQPIAILLASIVIVFIFQKFLKLRHEFRVFRRHPIDCLKDDLQKAIKSNARSRQEKLRSFRETVDAKKLWATRYCRVLDAYIHSGSQKAAAEIALDDSSFYQSASVTSYALPRILIWAIPLLGFIGTVVGISQAVTGFSSVLEGSSEIEQLKEGIGDITTGLAVAFDTTFLALLLSILVMIPLVLVERTEHRLLLGIDAYINDNLLSKLEEKESQAVNLQSHPKEVADQLERAASALQSQFNSLEKHTAEVSKIIQYQQNIGEKIFSSAGDERIQETLREIRDNLSQLKPVLENLDRPRRITLVENKED